MKRLLLLLLLAAGCASPTAPPPGDAASRNQWGGWDVKLVGGASCTLLASDGATAAQAIAFCRRALGILQ